MARLCTGLRRVPGVLGRGIARTATRVDTCSAESGEVFSFRANVFSFAPNVFSFSADVFSFWVHVSSFAADVSRFRVHVSCFRADVSSFRADVSHLVAAMPRVLGRRRFGRRTATGRDVSGEGTQRARPWLARGRGVSAWSIAGGFSRHGGGR